MADLHTYAKLPSDPCLTQEQITAYIDGKLSAADQYVCEKHMADCAMCEDALEGLALVKDRSVLALLLTTTTAAPEETKVIPLHQSNRRKLIYAVAAILVLVLGSTFLIKMMGDSDGVGLANKEESPTAVYDSIAAPGEGYAVLEDGKKMDSGDYSVTSTDGNSTRDLRSEKKPVAPRAFGPVPERADGDYEVAPDQVLHNEVVMAEESPQVFALDEIAETDNKTIDNQAIKQVQEKEDLAREEKKEVFWNRAKVNIPSGNTNGAGTKSVEQQTLVTGAATGNSGTDDNSKDKDANAPKDAPKTTLGEVTTISQTESPGASYDLYNDSGVNYANTVSTQDTTVAGNSLELSYINGVNLLAAGQPNAAITMFDKVLVDKNHPRYEDAEFQKAKALIKANRKEEAKVLLRTIETNKGKHAAEATELLKTL